MKTNVLRNFVALPMVALLVMGSVACNNQKKTTTDKSTTAVEDSVPEVTVLPVDHAQDFPDAKLAVSSIGTSKGEGDQLNLDVKYNVAGFTLTDQTEMQNHAAFANSHEGQHIHFILDNEPYVALYEPQNTAEISKGEHFLLSFLSRSFHESIKTPNAYVLKHFEIQDNGRYKELPVGDAAMLFYSRPKGEYKGEETKELLLDFYMVNCNTTDGYKILCDIDGQQFTLDQWRPYAINGLQLGKHTVSLTLIDPNGNPVQGTYGKVSREITLSE